MGRPCAQTDRVWTGKTWDGLVYPLTLAAALFLAVALVNGPSLFHVERTGDEQVRSRGPGRARWPATR